MKINDMNFRNISKTSHCYINFTICSEKIKYIFDFIQFSMRRCTPIINEWTGIAVLSCPGKYSSYIPTSIVIRLGIAVMGKYQ